MPLEEKTLKFLSLYKTDVDKMKAVQESLTSGNERVQFDPRSMRVTYVRGGQPFIEFQAELIGSYSTDDEIWRWGWANRRPGAEAQKVDAIYKEGQNYHIVQLTERAISRPGGTAAERLADTAAALAKAHGVFVTEEGRRTHYYAIYTDPKNLRDRTRTATQMMPNGPVSSANVPAAKPPPPPRKPSAVPPPMPARQAAPPPPAPVSARTAAVTPPGSLPANLLPSVAPMPMPAAAPPGLVPQVTTVPGAMPATQAFGAMPAMPAPGMMPQMSGGQMAPTQGMPMVPMMPMTQAMGAIPMSHSIPIGPMPLGSPGPPLDPERARQRFTPCAEVAIRSIMADAPDFRAAVFVITGVARDPRVYVPVIVVTDGEGNMRTLDPSSALVDACQQFVFSEYQVGALFWSRLEARVTKKATGGVAITIHMH